MGWKFLILLLMPKICPVSPWEVGIAPATKGPVSCFPPDRIALSLPTAVPMHLVVQEREKQPPIEIDRQKDRHTHACARTQPLQTCTRWEPWGSRCLPGCQGGETEAWGHVAAKGGQQFWGGAALRIVWEVVPPDPGSGGGPHTEAML